MKRATAVLTILIALAVGLLAGRYWQAPAGSPPATASTTPPATATAAPPRQPILVEAVSAALLPLPQYLDAVGSLRADETVVLRPEIAGRIERIGFREGETVTAGTVLFQLDDTIPRAELAQAQARQAHAQGSFERSQALRAQGFISAQALDQARRDRDVAVADGALARARLAKSQLRAPFAGEIGLRDVAVGDYVNIGQALVSLQATNPLKVDFRLPERDLGRVRAGQSIDLAVDALPSHVAQGRIETISPQVDVQGRALVLRAHVDNTDGTLRPGMFARVRVLLGTQPALLVPEAALVPRQDQQFVYRIDEGRATMTPVRLGLRREGQVEIVEGLSADDVVVVGGLQKLQDGTPVRVQRLDQAPAGPATAAPASEAAAATQPAQAS